jgi:hypothetical protein
MKKNLFVINENERSRILNMHETATKNNYVFEQETTTTTTTITPVSSTPAPSRYATITCDGKKPNCDEKVLKIQVRVNDECPIEVLKTKLVEDGIMGQKTLQSFELCKGKMTATKKKDESGQLVPIASTTPTVDKTISQETFDIMFNS